MLRILQQAALSNYDTAKKLSRSSFESHGYGTEELGKIYIRDVVFGRRQGQIWLPEDPSGREAMAYTHVYETLRVCEDDLQNLHISDALPDGVGFFIVRKIEEIDAHITVVGSGYQGSLLPGYRTQVESCELAGDWSVYGFFEFKRAPEYEGLKRKIYGQVVDQGGSYFAGNLNGDSGLELAYACLLGGVALSPSLFHHYKQPCPVAKADEIAEHRSYKDARSMGFSSGNGYCWMVDGDPESDSE